MPTSNFIFMKPNFMLQSVLRLTLKDLLEISLLLPIVLTNVTRLLPTAYRNMQPVVVLIKLSYLKNLLRLKTEEEGCARYRTEPYISRHEL